MMALLHMKGRSMLKIAMCSLLALAPAWALAQAPVSKNKAVSKVTAKPRMSASEEATAAAQAAAIAQAAAMAPAPVLAPAAAAVASPAVATVVSPAPAARVSAAAPASVHAVTNPSGAESVNAEELAIAKRVHQGLLTCELGTSIRVEPDAAQPGYFHLQGKGFRYRMRPVVTSTGAIRLEDHKAGAVWLQLANKSMLMDQKKGRRVADECANPDQLAYAEQMKTNPPPKLFDTTGMGR